jgi:transcriptional regulator with XRE-family HTH domain
MGDFTLKELRARKNETQQQVADALGISIQTYNAWERDLSNVGISKVVALAEHFGVRLDEIKFFCPKT